MEKDGPIEHYRPQNVTQTMCRRRDRLPPPSLSARSESLLISAFPPRFPFILCKDVFSRNTEIKKPPHPFEADAGAVVGFWLDQLCRMAYASLAMVCQADLSSSW